MGIIRVILDPSPSSVEFGEAYGGPQLPLVSNRGAQVT
jgi:hypothetical protein